MFFAFALINYLLVWVILNCLTTETRLVGAIYKLALRERKFDCYIEPGEELDL